MENRLRVFTGATRAAAPPDRTTAEAEDDRLARAAHEELRLMGLPSVNLLLRGRETAVRTVLDSLARNLHEPIASWSPGRRLELPAVEKARTMILHEVGSLDIEDQIHLLDWLGRAVGRTQVVSTTSSPLLPRVRAGAFIDTLYYRLNTVYLDVTP
jgi:Sigma-54 interaction domain